MRDRPPDCAPCRICGSRCASQLEFMDVNRGQPWDTCSGCDPDMQETDDQVDTMLDTLKIEEKIRDLATKLVIHAPEMHRRPDSVGRVIVIRAELGEVRRQLSEAYGEPDTHDRDYIARKIAALATSLIAAFSPSDSTSLCIEAIDQLNREIDEVLKFHGIFG